MKSKKELIDFVSHQVNVTLENNPNSILNGNRKILHTTIDRRCKNAVLGLLAKHGIRYESHVNNGYFIFIA